MSLPARKCGLQMNNNLLELQFDEILSVSIAQHHPEARKGNLFPIIMDMSYVYPLPVFYSYCMQRKVINTIDLKKRINDFFPCNIIGEKGTSRSTLTIPVCKLGKKRTLLLGGLCHVRQAYF